MICSNCGEYIQDDYAFCGNCGYKAEIKPAPEPVPAVIPVPEPIPEPEVVPIKEPEPKLKPIKEPEPELKPIEEPAPEVMPAKETVREVAPKPEPTPEVMPAKEPVWEEAKPIHPSFTEKKETKRETKPESASAGSAVGSFFKAVFSVVLGLLLFAVTAAVIVISALRPGNIPGIIAKSDIAGIIEFAELSEEIVESANTSLILSREIEEEDVYAFFSRETVAEEIGFAVGLYAEEAAAGNYSYYPERRDVISFMKSISSDIRREIDYELSDYDYEMVTKLLNETDPMLEFSIENILTNNNIDYAIPYFVFSGYSLMVISVLCFLVAVNIFLLHKNKIRLAFLNICIPLVIIGVILVIFSLLTGLFSDIVNNGDLAVITYFFDGLASVLLLPGLICAIVGVLAFIVFLIISVVRKSRPLHSAKKRTALNIAGLGINIACIITCVVLSFLCLQNVPEAYASEQSETEDAAPFDSEEQGNTEGIIEDEIQEPVDSLENAELREPAESQEAAERPEPAEVQEQAEGPEPAETQEQAEVQEPVETSNEALPLGFNGQNGADPTTEYYLDNPLKFRVGDVLRIDFSFIDIQGYDYGEEFTFLDENDNIIQSFVSVDSHGPYVVNTAGPFGISSSGVAVKVRMNFESSQGEDVVYNDIKFVISTQ
ncbi:MAG: zinc-ribbon domain-containing protein [Clostridiales bacterium]|jgi:hypothetical protein|nr:zinc-ribbon domain-containing protein [Clostridiales bacterium]